MTSGSRCRCAGSVCECYYYYCGGGGGGGGVCVYVCVRVQW